jgi:hypothetical protein
MFGLNFLKSKKEKDFETKEQQKESNLIELKGVENAESVEFDAQSFTLGFDFEEQIKSIKDLVRVYRQAAQNSEVEDAIDEIVNEAIVLDDGDIVDINLDNIELSDPIKKKIKEEFEYILKLLNFREDAPNLFKRWYIDGRMFVQAVVKSGAEKNGIRKIKFLSPLNIQRYKDKETGKYFYIYKEKEDSREGYRLTEDLITFATSGITNPDNKYFISHLHRAIKPLNQLRLLEDSAIIYRITRSPERRVFYIDVGKMPKTKADQYVKKLMDRFKNRISYNVQTGEMTEKKNVMTMLEDFYLPTSTSGKGTKVETLPGGQQLGEITDILYFKRKLYRSLKIPSSRVDDNEAGSPMVDFGRTTEITRAELKFAKFINMLKQRFSFLLLDLLKKQCIFKNIVNIDEWEENEQDIKFVWATDSYWEEMKYADSLQRRLEIARDLNEYVGKYFSHEFMRKEIFKQDDDDIKNEDKKMKEEGDKYKPDEADAGW